MGLSSLSSRVPGMCSRHSRVWVLLPVPDSPRKRTPRPCQAITEEWNATLWRRRAARLNIVQSPKRSSAGSWSGVKSVVTSGMSNRLRKRAGEEPLRGAISSR